MSRHNGRRNAHLLGSHGQSGSLLDEKPRVFIGSSTEGLGVAELIQLGLEHVADCTLWTQSTFRLSRTVIESLEDAPMQYDFGVFLLTPDDHRVKRGVASDEPRDNLWIEVGLFIGKLGRDRTFIVKDRDITLPSDLAGFTTVSYSARMDGNLEAALGPACTRIKQAMEMQIRAQVA
jgi:predicted nucleotide-binding protein